MKKTKHAKHRELTQQIGRLGPEAAIAMSHRRAHAMADRRTRRNRTRSAQNRTAIDNT